MSKTTRLCGALAVMVLGATAASQALAQGYVGGGIGSTRINVDCSGLDTCDKSDTGGKIYGGYLFGPQVGVELAYFDWGKAKGSGTIDLGNGPPVRGTGEVKGDGFGVGLAYIAPFSNDWSGVARIGVARNKGKTSGSALGFGVSESFTSTEAYLGLGVGYKLAPMLTLTGEADFSRLKYTESDKASTSLVTIGLRYQF
jgi:OOP family OmpA-OmpF porin